MRIINIAVLIMVSAAVLQAADPWIGTWRILPSKTRLDPPSWFRIEADGDGFRYATSGGLSYRASFDGKEYPVSGSSTFDTMKWLRIDARTVEGTRMKAGKAVGIETHVSSPDGQTRTATLKGTSETGDTFQSVSVYKRTAGDPSAVNPLLGEWEVEPAMNQSDFAPFRFEGVDGGLRYVTGATTLYTVSYDSASAVSSNQVFDEVSLRRINDRTIELVQKKNGKVVITWRYEVAPEGKTLNGTGIRVDAVGRTITTTNVSERQ